MAQTFSDRLQTLTQIVATNLGITPQISSLQLKKDLLLFEVEMN